MNAKEKKICVLSTNAILDEYKKYWSADDEKNVKLVECQDNKETVTKSCDSCFNHDLTLCHINAGTLSEEKRMLKVKKWTKKLWSHTSTNGLFITMWTGTATQKAFVGIAVNKAKIQL